MGGSPTLLAMLQPSFPRGFIGDSFPIYRAYFPLSTPIPPGLCREMSRLPACVRGPETGP